MASWRSMTKIGGSRSESGSKSGSGSIFEAWIRGSGSGSTPKCHGSATLVIPNPQPPRSCRLFRHWFCRGTGRRLPTWSAHHCRAAKERRWLPAKSHRLAHCPWRGPHKDQPFFSLWCRKFRRLSPQPRRPGRRGPLGLPPAHGGGLRVPIGSGDEQGTLGWPDGADTHPMLGERWRSRREPEAGGGGGGEERPAASDWGDCAGYGGAAKYSRGGAGASLAVPALGQWRRSALSILLKLRKARHRLVDFVSVHRCFFAKICRSKAIPNQVTFCIECWTSQNGAGLSMTYLCF